MDFKFAWVQYITAGLYSLKIVHISVLSGALCDMGPVPCGIYHISRLKDTFRLHERRYIYFCFPSVS